MIVFLLQVFRDPGRRPRTDRFNAKPSANPLATPPANKPPISSIFNIWARCAWPAPHKPSTGRRQQERPQSEHQVWESTPPKPAIPNVAAAPGHHWFSSDTILFSPFYAPELGVISTAHPGEALTVSNFGPANQIMVTSRLEGVF